MPLLRFRVHDVRFYIVGMNPSRVVRELARDDVVVTGRVDDVRPYLRHAALSVAPLHVARGVQNKILEAMAMGLPVIATTAAVTGLLVQRGVELHVADDPQTFARNVFQLLRREGADAMGAAARARILRSYTWEANLAPLQRVLAALHSSMPVNHGPAGIPASVGAQA
jgi:glycosyltransferase involved in cell wall biosynthesis